MSENLTLTQPPSYENLLRDYYLTNPVPNGRLVRANLPKDDRFAFNPSGFVNTVINGEQVQCVFLRTQSQSGIGESVAVPYYNNNGRLVPVPDELMPSLNLEDPFISNAKSPILGGVKLYPTADGTSYSTVFYEFTQDRRTLSQIAEGPIGMKDIRVREMPNGKLAVFTRPQGEEYEAGMVAFEILDNLRQLTPINILKATPLNLFAKGEWGGVGQIYNLKDGWLGQLCHVARYGINNAKNYAAAVFELHPYLGRYTFPRIITTRRDFPFEVPGLPDLQDVVFPSELYFDKRGQQCVLWGSISDSAIVRREIPWPFLFAPA